MRALGVHVFGGGFTMGVKEVMPVEAQLEIHELGRETVESIGVPFINEGEWTDWPEYRDIDFLYGNPRCTAFSCLTGSCGEGSHGPWAHQTKDIHDLVQYGIKNNAKIICWESVLQAYSTGRPLLDHLRDEWYVPNGYRVAHLMLNYASFGNAQHRRRYFCVAYKQGLRFNVDAPALPERHTTIRDAIQHLEGRETFPTRYGKEEGPYDPDSWRDFGVHERNVVPHMPEGFGLNRMGHKKIEVLEEFAPVLADKFHCRTSDMPFSLHEIYRPRYDSFMPVLTGNCGRYIHPVLNRGMTIRELSILMGWPDGVFPQTATPHYELGKGITPAAGQWIAEQAVKCLNNEWGTDDWECWYNDKTGIWEGDDSSANDEKVLNLKQYAPAKPAPQWSKMA